jgi:hypothetical protein
VCSKVCSVYTTHQALLKVTLKKTLEVDVEAGLDTLVYIPAFIKPQHKIIIIPTKPKKISFNLIVIEMQPIIINCMLNKRISFMLCHLN